MANLRRFSHYIELLCAICLLVLGVIVYATMNDTGPRHWAQCPPGRHLSAAEGGCVAGR